MKHLFAIPAIALLALTASCGGGKPDTSAGADSIPCDSACPAIEAEAIPRANDGQNAKKDVQPVAAACPLPDRQHCPTQPQPAPVQASPNEAQHPTSHSSISVSASYENEIKVRLQQLEEQALEMMAHAEVLRSRCEMAQSQGVQANPDEKVDLINTLDGLIYLRNEQIALAKKLGDDQLKQSYIDKAQAHIDTKNALLNSPAL